MRLLVALGLVVGAAALHARGADVPASGADAPEPQPAIALPSLSELHLAVPRPVRAASALLGLGRQRLALVVGIATVGGRLAIDTAPRDTQAVATALRDAGFVVMLRDDVGGAELRAALAEFRARLQPGGVGFVYATGLAAQVDGRNLLLPRETPLDPAASAELLLTRLRAAAVPVAELVDALQGPGDTPRILVLDAGYRNPGLARLPAAGLAEQKLPPGLMVLFGGALGSLQDVATATPLPTPPPADPQAIAASPFAAALVRALATPRISGPEALRQARRSVVDTSQGQTTPWIGGDTDAREEFAEATLLDGLVPRTPEEMAREGMRQGSRLVTRTGATRAGEQTVAEVLQQVPVQPGAAAPGAGPVPTAQAPAPTSANAPEPDPARPPANSAPAGNAGPAATVLGAAASAVGAAATVAGMVGSAAAAAATLRAAEAAAAVSVASSAVGVAGSAAALAGNAVALAARTVSSDGSEALSLAVPVAAAPAAPVSAAAPSNRIAPAGSAADVARATRAAQAVPAPPAAAPPPAARHPRATDGRTAPRSEGGERPVYTPRSNPFGYAEGDTYTYRVVDTWKDQVTGHTTTAIDAVLDSGQLLANGHQLQLDPQGRVQKLTGSDGSVSQFEPFQDLWWSNPQRGQSHAVQFTETFQRADRVRGLTEWTGSASVGRLRRIELPAGTFDAVPIETSGWWTETLAGGGRSVGQWSRTVWYSPKLGHPVAIDIQDADRLGKLLKRERVELLHAQSARAAP